MIGLTFKQYANLAYTVIVTLGFATFVIGYLSKKQNNRFSSNAVLYGATVLLLFISKYTLPNFSTFYLIYLAEIFFLIVVLINDFVFKKYEQHQKLTYLFYLSILAVSASLKFSPLPALLANYDAKFLEQIHFIILLLLIAVLVLHKAESTFVALWAINAIATLFIIFSMNPFGLETFIILRIIFYLIWLNQTWQVIEKSHQLQLKKSRQIEKHFDDVVRKEVKERLFYIEMSKERIAKVAQTDDLTGALNKKTLLNSIDKLIQDKRMHNFSILMFDIDSFKTINDTLGHIVGDKCLKHMAFLARQSIRDDDQLGRYGGDEFIILLPTANLKTAAVVAERFRKNVEQTDDPHFTISIGISAYPNDGDTVKALIAQADAGLYLSKQNGKNRCSYKLSEEQ